MGGFRTVTVRLGNGQTVMRQLVIQLRILRMSWRGIRVVRVTAARVGGHFVEVASRREVGRIEGNLHFGRARRLK